MTEAWKEFELWLSKQLNGPTGVRSGAVGRGGPDIPHPILAPECKERKILPKWLLDAMEQSVVNSQYTGKIPVVFLHALHSRHVDDIVAMRYKDWIKMWRDYEGIETARRANERNDRDSNRETTSARI